MPPPPHTLVGIDCATDARKVGIALATWNESTLILHEATCLGSWDAINETVASWCTPPRVPTPVNVSTALDVAIVAAAPA